MKTIETLKVLADRLEKKANVIFDNPHSTATELAVGLGLHKAVTETWTLITELSKTEQL